MNNRSSNLHYLSEYSTFDDVQELNYHVKQHTNRRYYDMNETQRQVLQIISQYAVNDNGACHLKVGTIANAISKSDRTVIRAINALVALNVIDRLSTTRRVSGGQGANIYRILPYVDRAEVSERTEDEKTSEVKDTTPIMEKETANLLSYKAINNTYGANARNTPMPNANQSPYIRQNTPYNAFKSTVQTFLGDSIHNANRSLIYRLYGVYLAQTKALRRAYDNDDLIAYGIEAIRISFTATKRKKLRNIAGYFNGVLSNILDDMAREEMSCLLHRT